MLTRFFITYHFTQIIMKYLYRGLSEYSQNGVLLKWHARVSEIHIRKSGAQNMRYTYWMMTYLIGTHNFKADFFFLYRYFRKEDQVLS